MPKAVKTQKRIMTKKELVDSMVKWAAQNKGVELTKKQAEAALKGMLESVREFLSKGHKVQLVPYGSWELRQRAARKGRNPKTQEVIQIPARKVPVFKVGKRLKEGL